MHFGAIIIGDEILCGKRQDRHMAKVIGILSERGLQLAWSQSSIIVRGAGESQLIDLMNECQARFPRAKVFSLPRMEPDRHIELGVRGDPGEVVSAVASLKQGVSALGFNWAEYRNAE